MVVQPTKVSDEQLRCPTKHWLAQKRCVRGSALATFSLICPTGSCVKEKKKKLHSCTNLVFQEAKKEEEIKVKALIYKDVDLYTANICWKGEEEDKLTQTVQVDTSLLLASCHLWDRDPTATESRTPIQRLRVCQPR